MKTDFTALFCFDDDFFKEFDKNTLVINSSKTKPGPKSSLTKSEVLTILISYYQSSSDCFKNYYKYIILPMHSKDFKLRRVIN